MATWKKRGPILGLALVCLMVAAYATGMPSPETQQPLPSTVPDLASATRVEVSDNGTVVLSGQLGPESDDGDEMKRLAQLTPASGNAKGEAEVELDTADRAKQELEVEVEGLTARTTYQVTVDGQMAGTITTDVRGKGNLELSRNTNQQ
jgi:hypothetical protein